MNVLGVIPARWASSRYPGKPLARIDGFPMVYHVYEAARKARLVNDIVVATDDDRVVEVCHMLKMHVLKTTEAATGTDRMALVAKESPADIYVNIQGDEPTLKSLDIHAVIKPLTDGLKPFNIAALCTPIIHGRDIDDQNVVKVVRRPDGALLYLSRLPIAQGGATMYYKQVGVYAMTSRMLESFTRLPRGRIEKLESIELMRCLEHGVPVYMAESKTDTVAVDTPSDLLRVKRLMEV